MSLQTERLTLRRPIVDDVPAMTAFYESERAAYVGGHVPTYRAFMNSAAILGHWDIMGYGLWAVTQRGSDEVVGLVGPFNPTGWPETEIGWMMFDGAEGQGYAIEAAKAAIHDAQDRLGWDTIVHYIDPANQRSIALAERLGAELDTSAPVPKPQEPCLVYRQPTKGGAA